jgi:hypothetical protein
LVFAKKGIITTHAHSDTFMCGTLFFSSMVPFDLHEQTHSKQRNVVWAKYGATDNFNFFLTVIHLQSVVSFGCCYSHEQMEWKKQTRLVALFEWSKTSFFCARASHTHNLAQVVMNNYFDKTKNTRKIEMNGKKIKHFAHSTSLRMLKLVTTAFIWKSDNDIIIISKQTKRCCILSDTLGCH